MSVCSARQTPGLPTVGLPMVCLLIASRHVNRVHPLRRRPLIPLLTVPVMLLAACSSGSSTSGSATGSAAAQPTAVSSAPASSASASSPAQPSAPVTAAQKPVPAEKNPPGDIPDNLAFVSYRNAVGRFTFRHPEGWVEKSQGAQVTFTDKLNGVQVMPGPTSVPTIASAKSIDVPALTKGQAAFELRAITAVSAPAGRGVRIVYRRNSASDPVTGRQYRDEVERYELSTSRGGLVMELFGPVGADNVDAYRTMVQSLRHS